MQHLTSPAETSLFNTPTLTFGEVGETGHQVTTGYSCDTHLIGQFDDTSILERMTFLHNQQWSVSDTGLLHTMDLLAALRAVPRNLAVLSQFKYYRSDVELTFRINTNQFFYGALMLTMYPNLVGTPAAYGNLVDERAVMDPTVISASSAESVIKEYKYSFPVMWLPTNGDEHMLTFNIDILAPLTRAKEDMPDSVTIQLWARYKNIQLAYPVGPTTFEAQSGKPPSEGAIPVHAKVSRPVKTPASDPKAKTATGTGTSLTKAYTAIKSITLGDAIDGAISLGTFVTQNWSSFASVLAFVLDKPDREVVQTPVITDSYVDFYATNMPDSNPSLSMRTGNYLDPSVNRLPMTKNWTVHDYASIPGLRSSTLVITPTFVPVNIDLMANRVIGTYMTPLDYSMNGAALWRGSIKVCLQFFTSAFISARILVQTIDASRYPGDYPSDYTSGMSRIINVKGDTIDMFTVPWMSPLMWEHNAIAQIRVVLESNIANTDTVTDPKIYCVVWVAAGEDMQFSFPDAAQNWGTPLTSPDELDLLDFEAQCSVPSLFQKSFPSIVPGAIADLDFGYCTTDTLGPITDICKRYSTLGTNAIAVLPAGALDGITNNGTASALDYSHFRGTYFGYWRAAFMYRSGGYKFRRQTASTEAYYGNILYQNLNGYNNNPSQVFHGVAYTSGPDSFTRMTFPQLARVPFAEQGAPTQMLGFSPVSTVCTDLTPSYVAARDDVQFGYPILPRRYVIYP